MKRNRNAFKTKSHQNCQQNYHRKEIAYTATRCNETIK